MFLWALVITHVLLEDVFLLIPLSLSEQGLVHQFPWFVLYPVLFTFHHTRVCQCRLIATVINATIHSTENQPYEPPHVPN